MDDYLPKSEFVGLAGSGGVPLAGGEFADENLKLLISFTGDPDKSNRDWQQWLWARTALTRRSRGKR